MDPSMGDSPYYQPVTMLDTGLTVRQLPTMRDQLLHSISNTMEEEDVIRVLVIESSSTTMDRDD